jgi:hypothetical protein
MLTLFLLLLLLLSGGGSTTGGSGASGGGASGTDVGQEILDVLALESLSIAYCVSHRISKRRA